MEDAPQRIGNDKVDAWPPCENASPANEEEAMSEIGGKKRRVLELVQGLTKQIDANNCGCRNRELANAKYPRRGQVRVKIESREQAR